MSLGNESPQYPPPYYIGPLPEGFFEVMQRWDEQQDQPTSGPRWRCLTKFRQQFSSLKLSIFFAYHGLIPVGYLLAARPRFRSDPAILHRIVVDSAHLRRGVGSLLMEGFGRIVMQRRGGVAIVQAQDEVGHAFMQASGWKVQSGILPAEYRRCKVSTSAASTDYVPYRITRKALEGTQVLRSLLASNGRVLRLRRRISS